LFKRIAAHQNGIGANYTKKHLPVCLVYFILKSLIRFGKRFIEKSKFKDGQAIKNQPW